MQEALNRGLLPDDNTLMQLSQEQDSIVHGRSLDSMRWPDLELRAVLIREASHDYSHYNRQQMLLLPCSAECRTVEGGGASAGLT